MRARDGRHRTASVLVATTAGRDHLPERPPSRKGRASKQQRRQPWWKRSTVLRPQERGQRGGTNERRATSAPTPGEAVQEGHESCVNGKLGTAPQRETVGDDFHPAVGEAIDGQVALGGPRVCLLRASSLWRCWGRLGCQQLCVHAVVCPRSQRAWTPWMAPRRPGPRCWRPHASARLRKPAGCRCGPADGPRAVAARRRGRLLRPCRRKRFTLLARKTKCLTLAARKKVQKKKSERACGISGWLAGISINRLRCRVEGARTDGGTSAWKACTAKARSH